MNATTQNKLAEALRNLTATARTFRNVPKDEQDWGPTDDEALDAAFAALAEHDAVPRTFTVFCRDSDGTGTTYITSVEAANATEAAAEGLRLCAEDWDQDSDTINVIGVCAGDVEVLEWDDEAGVATE